MYHLKLGFLDKYIESIEDEYYGVACKLRLKNNVMVSVISHQYSYGGIVGRYELMVIGVPSNGFFEDLDIPIDDVIGNLEARELMEYLYMFAAWKPKITAKQFYKDIMG